MNEIQNPTSVASGQQCGEHSGLVANLSAIKDILEEHGLNIKHLFEKIDEIKGTLIRRPSWAVTLYITLCTSAVGVCITIILFLLSQNKGP